MAIQTKPVPGEIVFGTNAEWFGDGVDDVGCTKASFFINGVLVSTDTNSGGHYHIGGGHLLWNTTLTANGSHTLRMTVTDTAGQTGSVEMEVIIANGVTPLEGWRQAKFTPAELMDISLSGNKADFESDGFSNLMEYALGTDPKKRVAPEFLPALFYETFNSQQYLALRYRRPQNGRPGLNYIVQVGPNLGTWNSGPGFTTESSIIPNADGTEIVTVRSNTPATSQPTSYIRLQVPPP